MNLVALTGRAGSGKSTIAQILVDEGGYVLHKMAEPLKDMLRAVGADEDMIEGDAKDEPSDLFCGRTPRYVMQTLGTEWGRNMIDPSFWSTLWRLTIPQGVPVVCDDLRFPNELECVCDMKARVFRVIGRQHSHVDTNHESEKQLAAPLPVINNTGSIAELRSTLRHLHLI